MPVHELLSVTVTVIGKVPTWLGVPERMPAEESVSPVGRVLDVVKVATPLPPLCVKVWLKPTPGMPVVVPGLVTVMVGQVVVKVPTVV